ncbi:penicillin-binding protein 1C [Rhodovarius crocodyli]|uniref:peptidoglycan glycosyltransferase n=1 Tax=Rhodovarius crocodyli TaxID=1979269 RepID=A0A437MEL7_9PROT|nr:penicillin-binding protein 1C [Rhodovarius crocodyli]
MRRRFAIISLVIFALAGAAWALDRALPPPMARALAVGGELTDRNGRTLSVLPAAGGVWRLATGVDDVPPHLVAMLVAAEDRRFWHHPGVDPIAMARAAAQWARRGHVVSGGSTLTMQVARLLEPRPRTLRAKAIETLRAIQLEWRYSKREILGLWLTLAPQGGNIEGIRAGSLVWFGRPSRQLDMAEAALLVGLARQPTRSRPDRHPAAARRARDSVLLSRAAPAVSEQDADMALGAPLPLRRQPLPRLAPHLARQLRNGPTTLDAGLQRAVETILTESLATLPDRASIAIMLAETGPRAVRALAGGAWMAQNRAGALDLSAAIRSPGSALKPLLYALAFQEGLVMPATLLSDMPRSFGSYAPENFDHGFAGQITVADALRQSLNLPAVSLLAQLGPVRFAGLLKDAGFSPRLPAGADPSLPLALGGAGFTLRGMLGLYATLADGGRSAPLALRPGPRAQARQVLEPHAAQLVGAILAQPFPAGGPTGIAWKTGTSWGARDAWAMGFDARHVAGVWVGRPDGTPMPGATGARLALPILARVMALVPPAPLAPLQVRAQAAPLAEAPDRLRLLFPPPGAVLEDGADLVIRSAGGQRPLIFMVDGAPIGSEPARREARWQPPGPGHYRITVLDAEGSATGATIRIR